MDILKKLGVVLVCLLCLAGLVYGGEEARKGEEGAAPVARAVYPEERDPFRVSRRLLEKIALERHAPLPEERVTGFILPRIEVTGFMVVGDKVTATAKIESVGRVILRPGEEIVVKPKEARRDAITFFVKEITPDEVVIILEGEKEIRKRLR
ncbi:hypothetical protein M1M90_03340 [Thermodesulfovibrionales bacterium]|nr:hypothetical protein [Thermodesulfovibrionales bacterium]